MWIKNKAVNIEAVGTEAEIPGTSTSKRRRANMDFSVQDKSNYLKGLLIIAKKDKELTEQEIEFIKEHARNLGFAQDFYEGALRSLLINKHISEEAIIFSDKKIAESFITDGLALANCDHIMVNSEKDYLMSVVIENDLDKKWFKDL